MRVSPYFFNLKIQHLHNIQIYNIYTQDNLNRNGEIKINNLCIFCGNDVSDLGTQVCAECKLKLEAFDIGLNHSKKDCIRSAVWSNGELRCAKCSRLIALAYKIDNQTCVFKLPQYKKYQIDLNNSEISFISELSYSDFDEYISELKKELLVNLEDHNGDDINLV